MGRTISRISRSAPLVLASASPRRAEILAAFGLPFVIETSGVRERRRRGEAADRFALRAAREKGEAVLARLGRKGRRPWILAADTIVVARGAVLGKPKTRRDAARMLSRLSGITHQVLSGIWVGRGTPCGDVITRSDLVSTSVTFRRLSDRDIAGYLETGEWQGKAGAYAIQGLAGRFVARVEGDILNVVGLPAFRVIDFLLDLHAMDRDRSKCHRDDPILERILRTSGTRQAFRTKQPDVSSLKNIT